jgi:hypothetical protein
MMRDDKNDNLNNNDNLENDNLDNNDNVDNNYVLIYTAVCDISERVVMKLLCI